CVSAAFAPWDPPSREEIRIVKKTRRRQNTVGPSASCFGLARLYRPVIATIESLSLEHVFGSRRSRWFLVPRRLLEFLGGSRVLRPTTGGERRGHQAARHAERA